MMVKGLNTYTVHVLVVAMHVILLHVYPWAGLDEHYLEVIVGQELKLFGKGERYTRKVYDRTCVSIV